MSPSVSSFIILSNKRRRDAPSAAIAAWEGVRAWCLKALLHRAPLPFAAMAGCVSTRRHMYVAHCLEGPSDNRVIAYISLSHLRFSSGASASARRMHAMLQERSCSFATRGLLCRRIILAPSPSVCRT